MRVLLSFTLLLLVACTSNGNSQTYKNINVATFKGEYQGNKNIQVLDVRTPEEIAQGKIANALEMDFNNPKFSERLNELDKSKPVVVYCAAGGRSAKASEMMTKLGFKEVINLEGGYRAYSARE